MTKQQRIITKYPIFHFVEVVLVFLILTTVVNAQTMSGIRIGDPLSSTSKIGFSPTAKEENGPLVIQKWRFQNKNELSITAFRNTGRIVYMETNWGGDRNGSFSDVPGMIYGKTTISDIRKRFGNNGFTYKDRGSVAVVEDGIIIMNSYQITGTDLVVTFITKISREDYLKTDNAKNVGSFALLDTIIIGDATYLDTVWGNEKMFDKGYKPVRIIR